VEPFDPARRGTRSPENAEWASSQGMIIRIVSPDLNSPYIALEIIQGQIVTPMVLNPVAIFNNERGKSSAAFWHFPC
jgi:hypothetical protein